MFPEKNFNSKQYINLKPGFWSQIVACMLVENVEGCRIPQIK